MVGRVRRMGRVGVVCLGIAVLSTVAMGQESRGSRGTRESGVDRRLPNLDRDARTARLSDCEIEQRYDAGRRFDRILFNRFCASQTANVEARMGALREQLFGASGDLRAPSQDEQVSQFRAALAQAEREYGAGAALDEPLRFESYRSAVDRSSEVLRSYLESHGGIRSEREGFGVGVDYNFAGRRMDYRMWYATTVEVSAAIPELSGSREVQPLIYECRYHYDVRQRRMEPDYNGASLIAYGNKARFSAAYQMQQVYITQAVARACAPRPRARAESARALGSPTGQESIRRVEQAPGASARDAVEY